MNKKGIVNLDIVRIVVITLLIVAILSILTFLITTTLRDTYENLDITTATLVNTTTDRVINESVTLSAPASLGIHTNRKCVLTGVTVTNRSTGSLIGAGNYTIATCQLYYTSGAQNLTPNNNSLWNVSGTYTYNPPYVNSFVSNLTVGTLNFFNQVPTFFTLLAVTVLILLIALVIIVISRYEGGQAEISVGGRGTAIREL